MLIATLLTLFACDRASDMQRTARTAQADADARISDASAKADETARAAQATADAKIATAEADFKALREGYRHTTALGLARVDAEITALEAKAAAAKGPEKLDREGRLRTIRERRAAFLRDYDTLETSSGASWDAAKARLDQAWKSLETSVSEA